MDQTYKSVPKNASGWQKKKQTIRLNDLLLCYDPITYLLISCFVSQNPILNKPDLYFRIICCTRNAGEQHSIHFLLVYGNGPCCINAISIYSNCYFTRSHSFKITY